MNAIKIPLIIVRSMAKGKHKRATQIKFPTKFSINFKSTFSATAEVRDAVLL